MSRLTLVVAFDLFLGAMLPFAHAEELDYRNLPVSELTQKAEAGDAEAQVCLGFAYHYGGGVSQDFQQAVKWYRKAAEQGNAAAQSALRALEEERR